VNVPFPGLETLENTAEAIAKYKEKLSRKSADIPDTVNCPRPFREMERCDSE
jgi:hypothetical protein